MHNSTEGGRICSRAHVGIPRRTFSTAAPEGTGHCLRGAWGRANDGADRREAGPLFRHCQHIFI
eukprot:5277266-Pyramimonas_sp.AAC.1